MKRLTSALGSRLGMIGFAALAFALAVPLHVAHAAPLFAVPGVTADTAALTNLMKIIYSDPLVVDIVNESELMDLFKTDFNVKSEETTGGQYIEMAHYLRLAGSAGARSENDYIPIPQNPKAVNSRIYLKKVMGVIEMTGDTMEKVVGDEGAFINYMERAMPDTKERVTSEMDRMYIGYGAGVKARVKAGWVAGGRTATALTVDRALGVTGYEDAWLQFTEGETIVFSNSSAGTAIKAAGSLQSALVDSVNEVTGALSIIADATLLAAIADNDFIFPGDAAGVSSQNGGVDRELAGLLAGVDDGGILQTYNNIDRTVTRQWKSRVFDGSAAPYNGAFTEELLVVADAVTVGTTGSKIDAVVTSVHAPISYWKDVKDGRRMQDARSFIGGMSKNFGVQLGDRTINFRTARKLPAQVAFGLNTASWRRFTLGTWQWVDRMGSVWQLVTDSTGRKDAYFAFGKLYEQLACITPRRNFRIDGLLRQFNY